MSGDWADAAACKGMNPDLWFPVRLSGKKKPDVRAGYKADDEQAKAVCSACPVIAECAAWAEWYPEPFGTWGGETEEERRVRHKAKKAATTRVNVALRAPARAPGRRLTDDEVRDIRRRCTPHITPDGEVIPGETQRRVAADVGVSQDCVAKVMTRRNHRDVA